MSSGFTDSELEAYLDEALTPDEMANLESELRSNEQLTRQLAAINARRDAGIHTLGEIWRRHRISCPTREHLGSFLLGALPDDQLEYITFHVERIGCRFCRANLDDMRRRQEEADDVAVSRRSRYFQSSAGYLRSDKP